MDANGGRPTRDADARSLVDAFGEDDADSNERARLVRARARDRSSTSRGRWTRREREARRRREARGRAIGGVQGARGAGRADV